MGGGTPKAAEVAPPDGSHEPCNRSMIPQSEGPCNQRAVFGYGLVAHIKECVVDRDCPPPAEPPLSKDERSASSLARAYGYDSTPYWELVRALIDGLSAFEALQGHGKEGVHGPSPLPAA